MQLCHRDCNRQQLLSQWSLSAHDLTIPILGHKPFCNTPQIPPRLDLHHVAGHKPPAEQTIHLCALAEHLAIAITKLRESEHSQRSFSHCITQKLGHRDSHSAPQETITRFAGGSKVLGACCDTLPGVLSLGAHRAELSCMGLSWDIHRWNWQ